MGKLFDSNYYLSTYNDVRDSDYYSTKPFAHYIDFGRFEARAPLDRSIKTYIEFVYPIRKAKLISKQS